MKCYIVNNIGNFYNPNTKQFQKEAFEMSSVTAYIKIKQALKIDTLSKIIKQGKREIDSLGNQKIITLLKHLYKMIISLSRIVYLIALNSNVYSKDLAKSFEDFNKLTKNPYLE